MTLLKRIKDYYDGKRNHYHLERAVPEPTEEDYKGEDAEVMRMNETFNCEYDDETLAEILSDSPTQSFVLGAEAILPKDIIDKLIEKPYKE